MHRSVAVLALTLLPASGALAQETSVESFDDVRAACSTAREGTHDVLYSIEVDGSWRFLPHEPGAIGLDAEGDAHLYLDTRRNLRLAGGRVELMPTRLEHIGFVASSARASELDAARAAGARLRIGFFLGFDEPSRRSCLLRPSGVSVVHMDVAYVELLEDSGAVIAREDTDRYASWSDDASRRRIPGSGPRAAVGTPSAIGATLPATWTPALDDASAGAIGMALAACHSAGVERGAADEGLVRVRVSVDAMTGRVTESRVEITDVSDAEETTCVADAFRGVAFPAAPGTARTVDLSVPVRLVVD